MPTERSLNKEKTLMAIMQILEGQEGIKIDKSNVHIAQNFTYKVNGEKVERPVLIVQFMRDGENITKVYDEKAKAIATLGKELTLASGVEIDKEQLVNAIEEKVRVTSDSNNNSASDTTKAGDGRDLANKEHEDEPKKENKIEEKENDAQDGIMKDLTDFRMSIEGKPLIRLNKDVNGPGQTLFHLLQIRSKLGNRLPNGINVESFEDGFFTYVDSSELTAKDGKERKTEEVPVITTRDKKHIIELDETILEPQEQGSIEDRKRREQSRQQVDEYGNTVKRPENVEVLTVTSRFKIVENTRNAEFGPDEKYITIQKMRDEVVSGKKDTYGYNREIYFERIDRDDLEVNRQRGYNARSEELQPYAKEGAANSAKESAHERNLSEYERAGQEINEHYQEMARELLDQNDSLKEVYNEAQLTEVIRQNYSSYTDEEKLKEDIIAHGKTLEGQKMPGDRYNPRTGE